MEDTFNNRDLLYANLSSPFPTGLIGQPDFASFAPNNGGISGTTLFQPTESITTAFFIFFADSANNRVLVVGPAITNFPTTSTGQTVAGSLVAVQPGLSVVAGAVTVNCVQMAIFGELQLLAAAQVTINCDLIIAGRITYSELNTALGQPIPQLIVRGNVIFQGLPSLRVRVLPTSGGPLSIQLISYNAFLGRGFASINYGVLDTCFNITSVPNVAPAATQLSITFQIGVLCASVSSGLSVAQIGGIIAAVVAVLAIVAAVVGAYIHKKRRQNEINSVTKKYGESQLMYREL